MIDNSLFISDLEISRKHKFNKRIILLFSIILLLLLSIAMNVRNYAVMISENSEKPIITDGLKAYETTVDEYGNEVFVDYYAAINKLKQEYQQNSQDEKLVEYLQIIENTSNRKESE